MSLLYQFIIVYPFQWPFFTAELCRATHLSSTFHMPGLRFVVRPRKDPKVEYVAKVQFAKLCLNTRWFGSWKLEDWNSQPFREPFLHASSCLQEICLMRCEEKRRREAGVGVKLSWWCVYHFQLYMMFFHINFGHFVMFVFMNLFCLVTIYLFT